MLPENNRRPKVEITMLGDFSITINGNRCDHLKGRTKRVWMLIEYLIANRYNDLPIQKIIDILWEESECGDPMNALKNLIYRARTLLRQIAGESRFEFILFERNTYCWNNDCSCMVDTEEFVDLYKNGCNVLKPSEQRLEKLLGAIDLYTGDFLPKSSYSSWVENAQTYYSNLYNDCVLKAGTLLLDSLRFQDAISLCEHALQFSPLEESIHRLLLYAYISADQRNKALDHYNYVVDLFYRKLGVDISVSLRPLYKQLINSINHIEIDLSVIKNDLKEAAALPGAFFCDYDVFKAVYRLQARVMRRSKQPTFIILFTLTDSDGGLPAPEIAVPAVAKLKDSILSSLRMGDAVSSYSATQFIILVPQVDYEGADKITKRILQRFRFQYRRDNVKIITRINRVDTAE